MSSEVPDLGAAATLDGTEQLHVVQGGVSKRTTAQDIADLSAVVTSVNGQTGAVLINTDGNTILNGTVDPTTEGDNGDFYLRTDTNEIFGPKAAGVWPAGVSIVGPTGPAAVFNWTGAWALATAYAVNDGVENDGQSYVCISAHTSASTDEPGVGVNEATYWDLTAAKGADGAGSVDSVNGQVGVVVLDPDDLDDAATTHKFTSAAEISKLAGIEAGADVTDATNVAAAGALMTSGIGSVTQAWDAELDTWATKTAPSGAVVGTTDTQTLSGKTIDSAAFSGTQTGGFSTTGNIQVASATSAYAYLSRAGTSEFCGYFFTTSGVTDWGITQGGASPTFGIDRYNAGVYQDTPFSIAYATGNVTMSGSLTVDSTAGAFAYLDANASGNVAEFHFRVNGNRRWVWSKDGTAEAGSNVGSDLQLYRYNDAGAYLDTPIYVSRATGNVTIANNLTTSGSITIDGAGSVDLSVDKGASGTDGIITFKTAGSNRFAMGTNSTAESGSNAGSNFGFYRYSDAGSFLSTPFEITRSTGNVSFAHDVSIGGALSKGSGSFKIDHPLKPDTHHLVHSFIEGPQADNIYRGKVRLVNGWATVNLDEAGRMTEGTFVVLNTNVQCFTSNEEGWTPLRGRVSENILTIEAQDPACTDEVSWLVIGERHDQHMFDTDWTDENGRVITEPRKEQING